MNDNQDYQKKIAEVAMLEDKRQEVQKRKLMLDDARTKLQYEELQKNTQELESAKKTSFAGMSNEAIEKIVLANTEYIKAAKNAMSFINSSFDGVIPFFRKNLILIGAKTGDGKSTAVANIVRSTLKQINPVSNRPRRVLVLTNEEKTEDVYNRVTCLANDWSYTNHDKFTDTQVKAFDAGIRSLSKYLTVIDNNHENGNGHTTSIEGVCNIFDNLIRDNEFYDVVLIDYYQNIKYSKSDPSMDEFKVQARLAAALDIYKNVYPAPIVLMCQVNPPDADDKIPFQFRIKGRKIIMDVATCALEIVADRENYRSQWTIHKSRFNESVGQGISIGFQRGRYVPYTPEFQLDVLKMKEARMMKKAGVVVKDEKKPTPPVLTLTTDEKDKT